MISQIARSADVTYDLVEAMALADRIVILKGGEIEQIETPDDVYNSPASVFVGSPVMNFAKGTIRNSLGEPPVFYCAGSRFAELFTGLRAL